MKISIISDEISQNISDVVEFLKKNNIKYIDLRSVNNKNLVFCSNNELNSIKKILQKNNIKVSCIASPLLKCYFHRNPEMRNTYYFKDYISTYQSNLEFAKKIFDITDFFNCKYIRIFSFLKERKNLDKETWDILIENYKKLTTMAESRNKILLLENEPTCNINKIELLLKCVKEINSIHFNILLDPGNLYYDNQQLRREDILKIAKYIKYLHIKDVNNKKSFCLVGDGIINYKRILSQLKDCGYEGFLSIETHLKENKRNNTELNLIRLKEILNTKRIRYALIGCGRVSRKHLDALKCDKNSVLYVVCDIDRMKAIKTSLENDCDFTLNLDEILNRKDIDVIDICTPSYLHKDMCIKALQNKKNVLVEKPLALNSKDIDKIIKIRDKYGLKVFVVHQKRFKPLIVNLFKSLSKNEFGRILLSNITLRWLRDENYYNDWHGKRDKEGGILLNQALHNIDILRVICGSPKRISGFSSTLNHKIETEDAFVASLLFQNGKSNILSTIEVTTCSSPQNLESSITLIGTKGSVKIGGTDLNKVEFWETLKKNSIKNSNNTVLKEWDDHFKVIKNVSLNLLGKKSKTISPEEVKETIIFIEKLYECSKYVG